MSALPSTINHPDAFMRSLPNGFDGVFDWSWSKGCFGNPKITPMDFDGVVERKGNFLVFETKDVGVSVIKGQLITFESLYALKKFTIVFIQGKAEPEFAKIWMQDGLLPEFEERKMASFQHCDKDRMADFCREWFAFANK